MKHVFADLRYSHYGLGPAMSAAPFHYPYRNGTLHYQISGSIGAALYPEGGLDYETLLKHADAALYAAKSGGKDRYVLYEPEQPLQGGE